MFDSSNTPPSNQPSDDPMLDILGDVLDASEQRDYQESLAALAYSVPEMPLNPNLKDRLFENLGLERPEDDIFSLLNLSIAELKRQAQTLTWEGMPDAPGFDMAIWQEHDNSRMMACFIRAEKPVSFPNHYHPDKEVIVVLGGDLVEEGKVYTQGDRITSAPNTSHQLDTTQGCLLFCIASMDNRFET